MLLTQFSLSTHPPISKKKLEQVSKNLKIFINGSCQ